MIPTTFDTAATLQFSSDRPTKLQFSIPEEWKNCKISLCLWRSDGSFAPPIQLDVNGRVTVDRQDHGSNGGRWMLSAENPYGKKTYSRIGRYLTLKEVTDA